MKTMKRTNRRNFLKAASLGGAGVAAAAVVATGRKPPEGGTAPGAAGPDGYHVTDHILKYYKTTEV